MASAGLKPGDVNYVFPLTEEQKKKMNEINESYLGTTELEDYQDFVASCTQPDAQYLEQVSGDTLKGWWAATQMTCEASEVLEIFEKAIRKGKDVDHEKVLDECGDTLWGLTCVLNTLGLSLDDCITHNINKLVARQNEAPK